MVLEGIPIQQLWAFLKWLPNFVLKWKFKPETLGGLVYVDLRPRGDSATINLGKAASFDLWLQIINLSPFEVVLDRANFNLRCGPVLRAHHLKREKILPGQIFDLWVSGSITEGEANQIAVSFNEGYTVSLDGHMDFNCDLHSFPKAIRGLAEIKPRVLNLQSRSGVA